MYFIQFNFINNGIMSVIFWQQPNGDGRSPFFVGKKVTNEIRSTRPAILLKHNMASQSSQKGRI